MRLSKELFSKANAYANYSLPELYEKLKDCEWTKLNAFQKKMLIKSIMIKELEQINLPYTISIDYISKKYDQLAEYVNAYYYHSERLLCMNDDLITSGSGEFAYSVLDHELIHVEQYFKIDNLEKFPAEEEYIVKLNECLNTVGHNISVLEKNVVANLHIYALPDSVDINMFYILCIAEREAYSKQYLIYEESPDKNLLLLGCKAFRDKYGQSFSDEDIYKIIDQCYHNLYENIMPVGTYKEQSIQATVMYDLLHTAMYMYDGTHNLDILTDLDRKRKVLAESGYTIYGEEPLNNLLHEFYKYRNDISLLEKLSIEEQRINPKLLLWCLRTNADTLNYIKDIDAFLYNTMKHFDIYDDDTQQMLIDMFPYCLDYERE